MDPAPSPPLVHDTPVINGINHDTEPAPDDLESELPVVYDGQIPLGDLLSRVVQAIYAELSELAETMPNMSDAARKRVLADWVVKTKKQVVKLYAVTKWARDAGTVQKCMNITAFLMNQNQQFENAIHGLKFAKDSLDPARLRNHDLLTSLDVLTTGSYRRLPSSIRKWFLPTTPLTDAQILHTLSEMEDTIRYRLRMKELVPVEMRRWRIADGRIYFTVPHLFETSLCLLGAQTQTQSDNDNDTEKREKSGGDGWFFVHVEFLIGVGGDLTGLQEFPREPTGIIRQHIADEADNRLSLYVPLSPEQEEQQRAQGVGAGVGRPKLGEGVVDVPLVRVFNFLQMMSLSYQLEILWYQAQRMRTLGWADYLKVEMNNNRKSLVVSYWVRPQPPAIPGRPPPPLNSNRTKLPPTGGTLSISIVEANASPLVPGGGPARSSKARVLAELQARSKLGMGKKPSDEVEGLKIEVRWETSKGAFGLRVLEEDVRVEEGELRLDPDSLDFEAMLIHVIEKHTKAVLKAFQLQLQRLAVFAPPGIVSLVKKGDTYTLQTHLVADEMALTTIDARTGRINLRDTGDLAAAGRGHRFIIISDKLNESPQMLLEALAKLRLNTIMDLAEQKANYLGLQSYRQRNFAREELKKLGTSARGWLYIQLSNFPSHYLVLVIADDEFRYALISVEVLSDTMYANLTMKDIGWLDIRRIHGENVVVPAQPEQPDARTGQKRKRDAGDEGKKKGRPNNFHLETQVLRELYAYCCARVAYTKVEQQFKLRHIPYTHVNPTNGAQVTTELAHIQSSLARSVPALCVQSSDILSGAPAAEAAMPNIRVIPLNWWSNKKAQVVTCVKLKYVQQPMGKRAGANIIRPSKRIIYDTTEAVVSFLSEDVDTCVDEFLEEWARVSKMVVIAREVGQMAKDKKWDGVHLLSFDLQTVEFAYSEDYSVSISCTDQLSTTGGFFDLRFSRCPHAPWITHSPSSLPSSNLNKDDLFNPHDDAEPFMRHILRHGRLAPSLHRLVRLLKDTLPIVAELEDMRVQAEKDGYSLDTFAKAAGWYRALYGDLRHALDFRLMSEQRVAILDGSYSLFSPGNYHPPPPPTLASAENDRAQPQPHPTPSTTRKGQQQNERSTIGLLHPIPGFAEIILDSIRDVTSTGSSLGELAPIDVGVVCDALAVRALGRAIHDRVRARLKD